MPPGVASITVSRCTPSLARAVLRERQHHAPAGLEVANSAVGHVRRAGGDDDRVDRELLAQVAAAVAVLEPHVLELERLQVAPRLAHQRADALDGVHLARDLREHGRLVAAAGADLEHALERRARSRASSVIRATTHGCEIVWPLPIGSGASS